MSQPPVHSRLFRTVGCAMCLAAVLATLEGHWMALQSFAWARMLSQYARQGSLLSAIAKTFDGRHPCDLCRVIKLGRQQEQQQNPQLPWVKLGESPDLICDLQLTSVPVPTLIAASPIPFVPDGHTDFLDSPPTPPPRAA